MLEFIKKELWRLVGALLVLFGVSLILWKIIYSATFVNVDFATLLSVALAFFSVGLSAAFYFKATDTSNAFYDNTYKFMQDVAGLLVRIESGFGERLKNIDDNYGRMRGYFEGGNTSVGEMRTDLKNEKKQLEVVSSERNSLITELLAQTGMQQEERDNFQRMLSEKDEELKILNREVSKLSKKLTIDRVLKSSNSASDLDSDILSFVRQHVLGDIYNGSAELPASLIRKRFDRVSPSFPSRFLEDMSERGYYGSNGLTDEGVSLIRRARKT